MPHHEPHRVGARDRDEVELDAPVFRGEIRDELVLERLLLIEHRQVDVFAVEGKRFGRRDVEPAHEALFQRQERRRRARHHVDQQDVPSGPGRRRRGDGGRPLGGEGDRRAGTEVPEHTDRGDEGSMALANAGCHCVSGLDDLRDAGPTHVVRGRLGRWHPGIRPLCVCAPPPDLGQCDLCPMAGPQCPGASESRPSYPWPHASLVVNVEPRRLHCERHRRDDRTRPRSDGSRATDLGELSPRRSMPEEQP
jgi:hypothetical protein